MPIQVVCQCGKTIRAADTLAGSKIPCRACKRPVQLPAAGTGVAPEEDELDMDDSDSLAAGSKSGTRAPSGGSRSGTRVPQAGNKPLARQPGAKIPSSVAASLGKNIHRPSKGGKSPAPAASAASKALAERLSAIQAATKPRSAAAPSSAKPATTRSGASPRVAAPASRETAPPGSKTGKPTPKPVEAPGAAKPGGGKSGAPSSGLRSGRVPKKPREGLLDHASGPAHAPIAKPSSSRRLMMLALGGALLIGVALGTYLLTARDTTADRVAEVNRKDALTGDDAPDAASRPPADDAQVIVLNDPPQIASVVPSGPPPQSPAASPLQPGGAAASLLARVASAYRALSSYQDQTTITVEDSSNYHPKTPGPPSMIDANSVQSFSGTVVVAKPDRARLSFKLNGNCDFKALINRERGLNSASRQLLNWSLANSNTYDVYYSGPHLWMTTSLSSVFQNGKADAPATRPSQAAESAVQIRPPENADRSSKLLRNSYGLELPIDRRWLRLLFSNDPESVLTAELASVTPQGTESIDGQDCDVVTWIEPVNPKNVHKGLKDLANTARAWVRRKDNMIVKVVREQSDTYPWIKDPSFGSILYAGLLNPNLPEEARSSFKRTVIETHQNLKLNAPLEPDSFSFKGATNATPIPIVHISVTDEDEKPIPGATAMLTNPATGLQTDWRPLTDADIQFDADDFRWKAAGHGNIERTRSTLYSSKANQVFVRAPGYATASKTFDIDWKNAVVPVTLNKGQSLTLKVQPPQGGAVPNEAEPVVFSASEIARLAPPHAYLPPVQGPDGQPRWKVAEQPTEPADNRYRELMPVPPFNLVTPEARGDGQFSMQLPASPSGPLFLWLSKAGVQPVVAGPIDLSPSSKGAISVDLPASGSLDITFSVDATDADKFRLTGLGLYLARELPTAQQPLLPMASFDARSSDFLASSGGSVRLNMIDLAAGTYTLSLIGEKAGVGQELFHRTITVSPSSNQSLTLKLADAYRGNHGVRLALLNADATPLVHKAVTLQVTVGGVTIPLASDKTSTSGRVDLKKLPAGQLDLLLDGRPFNTIQVLDQDKPQAIELQAVPVKGQPAPDFSATDPLTGKPVHLSDLKDKALLLDFVPAAKAAEEITAVSKLLAAHADDWSDRLRTVIVVFDDPAATSALAALGHAAPRGSLLIWSGGAAVEPSDAGRRYQLARLPDPRRFLLDADGNLTAGGPPGTPDWDLTAAISSTVGK